MADAHRMNPAEIIDTTRKIQQLARVIATQVSDLDAISADRRFFALARLYSLASELESLTGSSTLEREMTS